MGNIIERAHRHWAKISLYQTFPHPDIVTRAKRGLSPLFFNSLFALLQ